MEASEVAAAFHRDGYAVLEDLIPRDIVEEARFTALANFECCLVGRKPGDSVVVACYCVGCEWDYA